MHPHTIEVGWDYEVPLDEIEVFRSVHAAELESHYGAPVHTLTDLDVAKYMVRISHPSSHYLKPGQTELIYHD